MQFRIAHPLAMFALAGLLLAACDEGTRPDPVARVEIAPRPDSLVVDDTLRLQARVYGGSGTELTATGIGWSVSDSTLATVDTAGLVRAQKPGVVTVTATAAEQRDTVTLRLVPRERLIVLSPEPGAELAKPSTLLRVRLVGLPPTFPDTMLYRIGTGPERQVLFGCEPVTDCEIYVSGLPQGTSRVNVTVKSKGKRVEASTEVTVRSRFLDYRVTYLGTLGEQDSQATDINERGEVTGRAFTGERNRAFRYSGGRTTELTATGAAGAGGVAINDSGAVAGDLYGHAGCWRRPAIWQPDGGIAVLPEGCGPVTDITDTGAVLFLSCGLYLAEGGKLLSVRPMRESVVCAIRGRANSRGDVAVEYYLYRGTAVWTFDPTQAGVCPKARYCRLGDLNEAGTVVISADTKYQDPHELFLWRDSTLTRLGSYNSLTEARAINGKEEVIAVDQGVPVLWRAGAFYVIRAAGPGWVIDDVVEMNDSGQIVGHGRNTATGQVGAVLLDPSG